MIEQRLETYIERSRPFIIGLIAGRVNHADGEDLAQDVSVKVWRFEDRRPHDFWALVACGEDEYWLRTITGRTIIDHHRRVQCRREVAIDDFPRLVSPALSPEDLVWERDLIAIYLDWRARRETRAAKPHSSTPNAEAIRKTRDKQELKDAIRQAGGRTA